MSKQKVNYEEQKKQREARGGVAAWFTVMDDTKPCYLVLLDKNTMLGVSKIPTRLVQLKTGDVKQVADLEPGLYCCRNLKQEFKNGGSKDLELCVISVGDNKITYTDANPPKNIDDFSESFTKVSQEVREVKPEFSLDEKNQWAVVKVKLVQMTGKSYLLSLDNGQQVWIPKSHTDGVDESCEGEQHVRIKSWFLRDSRGSVDTRDIHVENKYKIGHEDAVVQKPVVAEKPIVAKFTNIDKLELKVEQFEDTLKAFQEMGQLEHDSNISVFQKMQKEINELKANFVKCMKRIELLEIGVVQTETKDVGDVKNSTLADTDRIPVITLDKIKANEMMFEDEEPKQGK